MQEIALVYGVGMIGIYDLGTMSPFTMPDNTVVIFTVVYTSIALMRSMINLMGAFRAKKKYGPPDPEDRQQRRNYNVHIYHRKCLHNCMILDEDVTCNHLPLMHTEKARTSVGSSETSLTHLYEADPKRQPSSVINLDISTLD
ncbi:hypothetical protein MSG28_001102 [Choristoneura fumiferana]|uniref:Uncharacterized protein n=1 Tax=Choristoneura fumiferana TaxID=7141 RepID=A0ACC0K3S9_CHOFU|nr:hypothetical protein MSG28_001102 [Choristoneura fumiferana]